MKKNMTEYEMDRLKQNLIRQVKGAALEDMHETMLALEEEWKDVELNFSIRGEMLCLAQKFGPVNYLRFRYGMFKEDFIEVLAHANEIDDSAAVEYVKASYPFLVNINDAKYRDVIRLMKYVFKYFKEPEQNVFFGMFKEISAKLRQDTWDSMRRNGELPNVKAA